MKTIDAFASKYAHYEVSHKTWQGVRLIKVKIGAPKALSTKK